MEVNITEGRFAELVHILKLSGIDLVVSFPCDWISDLLREFDREKDLLHLSPAREEEGVGICAGAYMAGKKPALIIQDSGIGNSINALLSLNLAYRIPILLIISRRGYLKEGSIAHVPMGSALPRILSASGIEHVSVKDLNDMRSLVPDAVRYAYFSLQPIAVILEPSFLRNDSS
ncbi:MAG: sulfopyruvate decarboxylase subunit alpha [Thaumarchaeota archaeon]|nr:sulfopyruvate decarboxylase subunit alpha [Nitrososphaerota archaeon]